MYNIVIDPMMQSYFNSTVIISEWYKDIKKNFVKVMGNLSKIDFSNLASYKLNKEKYNTKFFTDPELNFFKFYSCNAIRGFVIQTSKVIDNEIIDAVYSLFVNYVLLIVYNTLGTICLLMSVLIVFSKQTKQKIA